MRASRILLNAAKKGSQKSHQLTGLPTEMYPLIAATSVAVISATYFTYRHFAHGTELRLWKNQDLSEVDKVLEEDAKSKKQ